MLKAAGRVFWNAVQRMFEDDALPLAAALAYYSLLSMAPLLLVVISIAGLFFADGQVHAQLIEQMRSLIGEEGAALTRTVIAHTGSEERSAWSLVVGALLTLIGASTVFSRTVNAWISIVGLTMPVPRNAEPITTCAKPSASPGKNQ